MPYFGRPLKPAAIIGRRYSVIAVLRTPSGVLQGLPSGPTAPSCATYSVFLSGPENVSEMGWRGVGITPRYAPSADRTCTPRLAVT